MKPLLLVSFLAAGCASTVPPELRDARSEYTRVSNGNTAALAPADLHSAAEQLAAANKSFADDGDTAETRDLSYSAQRKAQLAEVRAQMIGERQERSAADTQVGKLKDDQLRTTSAVLSSTQAQLAVQTQQLHTAQEQKADAERRAQQAMADLARIASVKQETRGMVITLSGSLLFASAKSDLLGPAQAKLSEVASVLVKQNPDATIVVQGYTDSQGGEAYNLELSRKRAEAVRTYLVSHGIAADQIKAEGNGPANPIADNASAEGRADNRRVEIVVHPKAN